MQVLEDLGVAILIVVPVATIVTLCAPLIASVSRWVNHLVGQDIEITPEKMKRAYIGAAVTTALLVLLVYMMIATNPDHP
jgi:hypothetical protein